MPERKNIPYLRLVAPLRQPLVSKHAGEDLPQPVLALLNTSRTTEAVFRGTLMSLRPRWVFDLRPIPCFDIGRLSRRSVFEMFCSLHTTYKDVSGTLDILTRNDASLNSGAVAEVVNDSFGVDVDMGDILVLLDSAEWLDLSARMLPRTLLSPRGWDVRTILNTSEKL